MFNCCSFKTKIQPQSSLLKVSLSPGSSVVLHCGARGNPQPSIIWTKKNRDLAGLDHSIRNKTLVWNANLWKETNIGFMLKVFFYNSHIHAAFALKNCDFPKQTKHLFTIYQGSATHLKCYTVIKEDGGSLSYVFP